MAPIDTIGDREAVASATKAAEFLGTFLWRRKINRGYLAWWCPGLFGVFKFHITPNKKSVPDTVWVVVNNIPPACSVCDDAENWQDALKDFIWEMRRWIKSDPSDVDIVALEKHLRTLEDAWVNAAPEGLPQGNLGQPASIEHDGPVSIS
jgi:hypothetical protein